VFAGVLEALVPFVSLAEELYYFLLPGVLELIVGLYVITLWL